MYQQRPVQSVSGLLGVGTVKIDRGVTDSARNPGGDTAYYDHIFLLDNAGFGIEFASLTFGSALWYRQWYSNAPTTDQSWKRISIVS